MDNIVQAVTLSGMEWCFVCELIIATEANISNLPLAVKQD